MLGKYWSFEIIIIIIMLLSIKPLGTSSTNDGRFWDTLREHFIYSFVECKELFMWQRKYVK